MPALYIGHGAPMLLDDPLWTSQLREVAKNLPKPKAILIISAHWESEPVTLSSAIAGTELIYDFGGFAPKYYQMKYETPDASWLSNEVSKLLPDNEEVVHANRGLDHGAWVPLKVMYPTGDIPVIQMSMPTSNPEQLMKLGKKLQSLREQGVLIIGSGFMTHGLPFLRDWRVDAQAPSWSAEFDLWAAEALATGDIETLTKFKELAPGMPYAHPTVEHFTPLFVTLGAATNPESAPDTLIDGYFMGLAKRSILVV